MTVSQALNKGINFLSISVFGMIGIGALHEVIGENDLGDKVEDAAFVLLTVIAILWYLLSKKALKRTLIPLIFLLAGFITKCIGLYIERADKDANIPDFAYVGMLGITILIFMYQYYKFRKFTG